MMCALSRVCDVWNTAALLCGVQGDTQYDQDLILDWYRLMWLSNRDCCQVFEKAIDAHLPANTYVCYCADQGCLCTLVCVCLSLFSVWPVSLSFLLSQDLLVDPVMCHAVLYAVL